MPWFWQAVLFVIFVVPVFVLFGYATYDVIRRHDTPVWHKALWLVVFCFVPIIGPLIYLVIRPPGTTNDQRRIAEGEETAAQQLERLADLHERGKLTDEEYSHAKAQQLDPGVVDIRPGNVREQRGSAM